MNANTYFQYNSELEQKAVFSLLPVSYYSGSSNSELYKPILTDPIPLNSTDTTLLSYYVAVLPNSIDSDGVILSYTEVVITNIYAYSFDTEGIPSSFGSLYDEPFGIAEFLYNGSTKYNIISKKVVRINDNGFIKYGNALGVCLDQESIPFILSPFSSINDIINLFGNTIRFPGSASTFLLGHASCAYNLKHNIIYESDSNGGLSPNYAGLSIPSEVYNKWYRFTLCGITDIGGETPDDNLAAWGAAFLREQRINYLYPVTVGDINLGSIHIGKIDHDLTDEWDEDYPILPVSTLDSLIAPISSLKEDTSLSAVVDGKAYPSFSKAIDLTSHGNSGNLVSWEAEKYFVVNEPMPLNTSTLTIKNYIDLLGTTVALSYANIFLYDNSGTGNAVDALPDTEDLAYPDRHIIVCDVIPLAQIVDINGTKTIVSNNAMVTALGIVNVNTSTIDPTDLPEEEDYTNEDWEIKLVLNGSDYTVPYSTGYTLDNWKNDIELAAGGSFFPIRNLILSLTMVQTDEEFEQAVISSYGQDSIATSLYGLLYCNRQNKVSNNLFPDEATGSKPLYIILNSFGELATSFTADSGYTFNMGVGADLLRVGDNYWNVLSNKYVSGGYSNDKRVLLCIESPNSTSSRIQALTVKNERVVTKAMVGDRVKNTIVVTVVEESSPIPHVTTVSYNQSYEGHVEESVNYTTNIGVIRADTLDLVDFHLNVIKGTITFSESLPATFEYIVEASSSSWFEINSVSIDPTRKIINFQVRFTTNNSSVRQMGMLFRYTQNNMILELFRVIIPQDVNPEKYNPVYDDEEKYWQNGDTFTLIDINNGSDYSSTSLLFKNNHTNIYKTINQKDNTLFLGNYKSIEQEIALYKRLEEVSEIVDVSQLFTFLEKLEWYPLSNLDGDWYGYTPDLTLDSAQKRLFKKGEKYNIGVSFLHKTGYWSSVFIPPSEDTEGVYIWEPSTEPSIQYREELRGEDLVKVWYLVKPVLELHLNKEAIDAMLSLGFIGAIPVRIEKQSHSILALGLVEKALTNAFRKEHDYIDYLYSWSSKLENDTLEQKQSIIPLYGEYAPVQWGFSNRVFTLNSPEVEANDYLLSYTLEDSQFRKVNTLKIKCIRAAGNIFVNGSTYLHSKVLQENIKREPYINGVPLSTYLYGGAFFHGFLDLMYGIEAGDYTATDLNEPSHYADIRLFYWNRERLSGENATLKKSELNYLILENDINEWRTFDCTLEQTKVFRDFDSVVSKTLKINGENSIYQANTDVIIPYDVDHPYANIGASVSWFPENLGSSGWAKWTHNRGNLADLREGTFWYELHKEDTYPNSDYGPYGMGSKIINGSEITNMYGIDTQGHITDPINIRYKCAPHIYFSTSLDLNGGDLQLLFGENSVDRLSIGEIFKEESIDFNDVNYLLNQIWVKCGEIRRLKEEKNLTLTYEEGDYFYGRFDSLRVEPYAQGDAGDVNQNTEIVSFLCSSKINLDARTDTYRGVTLPVVNHTNFNRFNHVYDQSNNYFTFTYIDYSDAASSDSDPSSIYERSYTSSILWSLTKSYGEEIDSWLNIQDINTLDLDGDKGVLVSIEKLGNNLLNFLETGVSLIMFNEKTIIEPQQGVPVEIANSNKVTGKYYYYDNVGCLNQRAIAKGLNGLYFIDSINKSIFSISNKGELNDLGTSYEMKSWVSKNINKEWWAYYDIYSHEILFASENNCIAFDDLDPKFSCLLPGYNDVMWNYHMNGRTYLFNPINYTIWKKNVIDKTVIFGVTYPLVLTFIANPESSVDKTFSTIEYRADVFGEDEEYLANDTFTSIQVTNEFLDTLEVSLNLVDDSGINILLKKFRIWRIDIPRDKIETNDRIRNPWCKVKLKLDWSDAENKAEKFKFYNLGVSYFY